MNFCWEANSITAICVEAFISQNYLLGLSVSPSPSPMMEQAAGYLLTDERLQFICKLLCLPPIATCHAIIMLKNILLPTSYPASTHHKQL
jgi:hypothetical protein